MKIVFDTNVLLSGLFTRGLCESLLNACLGNPDHEVVTCEGILEEFMEHATAKFQAPPDRVRKALRLIRAQVTVVNPAAIPAGACRDPDDLMVLGTVVAAEADVLVTGDKDLLVIGEYSGCRIINPRQLFESIRPAT